MRVSYQNYQMSKFSENHLRKNIWTVYSYDVDEAESATIRNQSVHSLSEIELARNKDREKLPSRTEPRETAE